MYRRLIETWNFAREFYQKIQNFRIFFFPLSQCIYWEIVLSVVTYVQIDFRLCCQNVTKNPELIDSARTGGQQLKVSVPFGTRDPSCDVCDHRAATKSVYIRELEVFNRGGDAYTEGVRPCATPSTLSSLAYPNGMQRTFI